MRDDDTIFLRKRLKAAEGYLDLGMYEAAWQEVGGIEVEDLTDEIDKASYMEQVVSLAMHARDWELGAQAARAWSLMQPLAEPSYLHGAYCLHEMGKTREALDLLLNGAAALEKEPLFYYNMGCYYAVLGKPLEAMACLNEAFQRNPELRINARGDADLKGLGTF